MRTRLFLVLAFCAAEGRGRRQGKELLQSFSWTSGGICRRLGPEEAIQSGCRPPIEAG
jgi:hypothetical protein